MSNYSLVNFAGSGLTSTTSTGLSLSDLDQRYLNVNGGDKMLANLDEGTTNI